MLRKRIFEVLCSEFQFCLPLKLTPHCGLSPGYAFNFTYILLIFLFEMEKNSDVDLLFAMLLHRGPHELELGHTKATDLNI